MQGPGSVSIGLVLVAFAGACTSGNAPTLPPSQPAFETGNLAQAPIESALIVSGTPTEVYALVARGALGCWFGADGPLKATHVFQAEAAPPVKGGAAEIVIHERDVTLRDQRGVRACRIAFAGDTLGVRVVTSTLRIEPQLAQLMEKDVEVWARGGSGCQVRTLFPAPAAVPGAGKAGPGAAIKKR